VRGAATPSRRPWLELSTKWSAGKARPGAVSVVVLVNHQPYCTILRKADRCSRFLRFSSELFTDVLLLSSLQVQPGNHLLLAQSDVLRFFASIRCSVKGQGKRAERRVSLMNTPLSLIPRNGCDSARPPHTNTFWETMCEFSLCECVCVCAPFPRITRTATPGLTQASQRGGSIASFNRGGHEQSAAGE
jgi:hypothetical protein